jgi:hypothetical protein
MTGRGNDGVHEFARIERLASTGRNGPAGPGAAHAYVEDLIGEEARLREMAAEDRHAEHVRRLHAVEQELNRLAHLLRRRTTSGS